MEIEEGAVGEVMNYSLLETIGLVVCATGICCALAILVGRSLRTLQHRKELRVMRDRLKAFGAWIRYRTVGDIIGVASDFEFQQELALNTKKIDPWDKVVLMFKPTFTFAKRESVMRPIHTGLREDLDEIIRTRVREITGYGDEGLSGGEWYELLEIIMIKDERLFVPYAGTDAEGKWQFKIFGQKTLAEARELLL